MSRHFNYELDERRVKILLKENSMPYSDDVWNSYLEKTKPLVKVNKLQSFKPNVNFAINKGALLTGVFVILIGSFTLLIAKFVDFSSAKSNIEVVREVKPEPDNYKIEKTTAALPEQKEVKPIVAVVDSSLIAKPTGTLAAITPSVASNVPAIANNTTPTPDTVQNKSDKDSNSVSRTADKPRKKKKKEAETLESKPLTTELPTTGSDEPELELK